MYIYIAYLPCRCCYYNSLFTDLLIADIDSFPDLDNSVYTILAPAPIPAKPAKITPAIYRIAAYKAKRRKSAKACAIVANKDDNNAYNRAYIPPTDIEEEKGSSSNNNSINGGTSDSTDKGKGSSAYKHSKGASRYKNILLYKQQYVASYPYSLPGTPYADIYIYYV
ncbi:hypothetical protein P8C59_000014 [Phyllachora maydis]|uniref:Uncharacterized protein n=1 Tax=Phyllachora maydis TaxID=1825666 RepID=A0AAD9M5S1_9PEZI|nr:hypothetical protein P8C59_000014 [Phyllachora maydis]